jgi:hypothetical protein
VALNLLAKEAAVDGDGFDGVSFFILLPSSHARDGERNPKDDEEEHSQLDEGDVATRHCDGRMMVVAALY